MVSLTSKEAGSVFRIMAVLAGDCGSGELRRRVGSCLLDLFDAQYFASYVWSHSESVFDHRVAINMSSDNLNTYEAYFQFRDPITPLLQRRRRATSVADVITRRRLERTEFFNDFLARDGLHYGMNYYAYSAGLNIGDLRIWRGRGREEFSRRDIAVLDAIGPAFTNAMRVALAREGREEGALALSIAVERLASQAYLTRREKEVVFAVLLGKTDKQIAAECGIAYTTVRTHLKHVFEKLGVTGRSQLFRRVALH